MVVVPFPFSDLTRAKRRPQRETAEASGNLARLETDEKTEKMSKKTYRISKILKTEVNQNPQKTMNIIKSIGYSID